MNLNSVRFPGLDGEYKIPQTAADVGAAPAGYGYGEALPTVTGATDTEFLSNIEALCREKISFSTFNAIIYPPGSVFDGYSFIAEIWHRTDNNGNKFIKIKAHGVTATWAFQRVCYLNTWSEPEWENPPMIPGVEYRTTERWNGKAVYAQYFDFGYLPNNTFKSETLPVSTKVTHLVDYYGHMRYSTESAEISMTYAAIRFQLGYDGIVRIDTSENLSTFAAKFVVKYTKD